MPSRGLVSLVTKLLRVRGAAGFYATLSTCDLPSALRSLNLNITHTPQWQCERNGKIPMHSVQEMVSIDSVSVARTLATKHPLYDTFPP